MIRTYFRSRTHFRNYCGIVMHGKLGRGCNAPKCYAEMIDKVWDSNDIALRTKLIHDLSAIIPNASHRVLVNQIRDISKKYL